MNIMHIVTGLNLGGLENLVADLVDKLNKKYINTFLCSLDRKGHPKLIQKIKKSGAELFFMNRKVLPGGVDYILPFSLSRQIKQRNISLVHTHNAAAHTYGLIAARLAGVPAVINTIHGRQFHGGEKRHQKRRRIRNIILAKFTDKFIAVSQDMKNCLIRYENVHPGKIDVIFNGVEINKKINNSNIQKIKKELGLNSSDLIIGIVARLAVVKGHRTLLKAFAYVSNTIANVKLLIIGDGPLTNELEKYALELKISKKVIFLGTRNDINDLLSLIDVFTLSSVHEGISLTLLEAMASKKPIVTTAVGGNVEVVRNNITGILVPPNNPKALADALSLLLLDKDKAKKMGESGYIRYKNEFTLDKMVYQYEHIYENLLNIKINHK